MEIKEFDRVLLKTGETGYICDLLRPGIAYVVDIDKADGSIRTDVVEHKDIEKVIPIK